MRAKLIYEKFSEKSDPITDMGIGGITFSELLDGKDIQFDKAVDEVKRAEKQLEIAKKEYLSARKKAMEQFVGKKITAFMGKTKKSGWGHVYGMVEKKEYTIKVKRTICRDYGGILVSNRDTEYILYPESKIVVHD